MNLPAVEAHHGGAGQARAWLGMEMAYAGAKLVKDLDLLRRRMAGRECPYHGRARSRRLALLFGVRWRPHLRRCVARSRFALRAGECLRRNHASQAGRIHRAMARADPRGYETL